MREKFINLHREAAVDNDVYFLEIEVQDYGDQFCNSDGYGYAIFWK